MNSDRMKLFRMSHQMVETALDQVEKSYKLDLGRDEAATDDKDDEYYPQFSEAIRREAAEMGLHYELFYCLEKSIRSMIAEKLLAEHGVTWWEEKVPPKIREDVKNNMKKEIDAGFTPRSSTEIDYTTLGQLGDIVRFNWDSFSDTFNSQKAFTKVMANLNVLRGPIAHCSPLAEDEVVRLKLTVKDWFRTME